MCLRLAESKTDNLGCIGSYPMCAVLVNSSIINSLTKVIKEQKSIELQELGLLNPTIKIVDVNPSTFWLILPTKINPETEEELSEVELEMVSGGYDGEGQGSEALWCNLFQYMN